MSLILPFGVRQSMPNRPPLRERHRARLVAADDGPEAFAVDVDVDGRRRAHLAAAGKLRPAAAGHHRAAAVEPSHFYGPVGIGESSALRRRRTSRGEEKGLRQSTPASGGPLISRAPSQSRFYSTRLCTRAGCVGEHRGLAALPIESHRPIEKVTVPGKARPPLARILMPGATDPATATSRRPSRHEAIIRIYELLRVERLPCFHVDLSCHEIPR